MPTASAAPGEPGQPHALAVRAVAPWLPSSRRRGRHGDAVQAQPARSARRAGPSRARPRTVRPGGAGLDDEQGGRRSPSTLDGRRRRRTARSRPRPARGTSRRPAASRRRCGRPSWREPGRVEQDDRLGEGERGGRRAVADEGRQVRGLLVGAAPQADAVRPQPGPGRRRRGRGRRGRAPRPTRTPLTTDRSAVRPPSDSGTPSCHMPRSAAAATRLVGGRVRAVGVVRGRADPLGGELADDLREHLLLRAPAVRSNRSRATAGGLRAARSPGPPAFGERPRGLRRGTHADPGRVERGALGPAAQTPPVQDRGLGEPGETAQGDRHGVAPDAARVAEGRVVSRSSAASRCRSVTIRGADPAARRSWPASAVRGATGPEEDGPVARQRV